MLNTRNTQLVETKEVLNAVTVFNTLYYEQALKLLSGKEKVLHGILRNLSNQNRIYHDISTGIIADSRQSAENPNMSMIKAIWVFLEFNDKVEYYTVGDYPVLISFFINEEYYEIIYAAYGNEVTLNFALSKNGGGSKKLIIIDNPSQIKKLKIQGLLCFCVVTPEGAVQFFKIE